MYGSNCFVCNSLYWEYRKYLLLDEWIENVIFVIYLNSRNKLLIRYYLFGNNLLIGINI